MESYSSIHYVSISLTSDGEKLFKLLMAQIQRYVTRVIATRKSKVRGHTAPPPKKKNFG